MMLPFNASQNTSKDTRVCSTDRLVSGQSGTSMVEYALLLGLLVIVAIGALHSVGTTSEDMYSSIASVMTDP